MNTCLQCNKPATYKNLTQFAGTHYWCTQHAQEQGDCDEFLYIVREQDVTSKILSAKNSGDGAAQVLRLTHTPTGVVAEGQGRSQHRARDLAWTELNKLLQEHMQLAPQQVVADTLRDLQRTTKQAKERAADAFAEYTKVQYLLDKLQEEAAEVIQAVSKIRRFGPQNHHPDRTTTNLQELVGELEDLQAIVLALEEMQYFDPKPSTTSIIRKFNTLLSS